VLLNRAPPRPAPNPLLRQSRQRRPSKRALPRKSIRANELTCGKSNGQLRLRRWPFFLQAIRIFRVLIPGAALAGLVLYLHESTVKRLAGNLLCYNFLHLQLC
jgi:hypothetical protein